MNLLNHIQLEAIHNTQQLIKINQSNEIINLPNRTLNLIKKQYINRSRMTNFNQQLSEMIEISKNSKSIQQKERSYISEDKLIQFQTANYQNSKVKFQNTQFRLLQMSRQYLVSRSYLDSLFHYIHHLPLLKKIFILQQEERSIHHQQSHYHNIINIVISRKNCIIKLKQNLLLSQDPIKKQLHSSKVLQYYCRILSDLRQITLVLIQRVQNWKKWLFKFQLETLKSQKMYTQQQQLIDNQKSIFYYEGVNILQSIQSDTLFLRNTVLRKYIFFSKSSDPLFLCPYKLLHPGMGFDGNLGSSRMRNYQPIVNLFELPRQLLQRLEHASFILKQQSKFIQRSIYSQHDQNDQDDQIIKSNKCIKNRKYSRLNTSIQVRKNKAFTIGMKKSRNSLESRRLSDWEKKQGLKTSLKKQIKDDEQSLVETYNPSISVQKNERFAFNKNKLLFAKAQSQQNNFINIQKISKQIKNMKKNFFRQQIQLKNNEELLLPQLDINIKNKKKNNLIARKIQISRRVFEQERQIPKSSQQYEQSPQFKGKYKGNIIKINNSRNLIDFKKINTIQQRNNTDDQKKLSRKRNPIRNTYGTIVNNPRKQKQLKQNSQDRQLLLYKKILLAKQKYEKEFYGQKTSYRYKQKMRDKFLYEEQSNSIVYKLNYEQKNEEQNIYYNKFGYVLNNNQNQQINKNQIKQYRQKIISDHQIVSEEKNQTQKQIQQKQWKQLQKKNEQSQNHSIKILSQKIRQSKTKIQSEQINKQFKTPQKQKKDQSRIPKTQSRTIIQDNHIIQINQINKKQKNNLSQTILIQQQSQNSQKLLNSTNLIQILKLGKPPSLISSDYKLINQKQISNSQISQKLSRKNSEKIQQKQFQQQKQEQDKKNIQLKQQKQQKNKQQGIIQQKPIQQTIAQIKVKNIYTINPLDLPALQAYQALIIKFPVLVFKKSRSNINLQLLQSDYKMRHFYFSQIAQNGKIEALAISQKIHIGKSRLIRIWEILNVNELQLKQETKQTILREYLKYIWSTDPTSRILYIDIVKQKVEDNRFVSKQYLISLGFKKVVSQSQKWKNFMSEQNILNLQNILYLERSEKNKQIIAQIQQACLSLQLTNLLTLKTQKKIFYSFQIQSFTNFNYISQYLLYHLLKSTIKKYYAYFKQQHMPNISKFLYKNILSTLYITAKVDHKCYHFTTILQLNRHLAQNSLQVYQTKQKIENVGLGQLIIRQYKFNFPYLINNKHIIFYPNNKQTIYGYQISTESHFVLLKLNNNINSNQSNVYFFCAKQKSDQSKQNKKNKDMRSITKQLLKKIKNSNLYDTSKAVKIRFFNRQLYGRIANIDNIFSLFGSVEFIFNCVDYMKGVKIFNETDVKKVVVFDGEMIGGIISQIKGDFMLVYCSRIQQNNYL